MAAGRDCSKDYPGDSSVYVIKESAASMMGMQNDADGKQVKF
jgi:hypothetical protein